MRRFSISLISIARTSRTSSCSRSGSRPRAARLKRPTLAASRICWAKARRCNTRSGRSRTRARRFRGCRFRPPDDYLRDAMVAALPRATSSSTFACSCRPIRILMPIENNGVLWPEKLSPRSIGRHPPSAKADIRFARANGVCRRSSLTIPGIPSPSIVRWVIKAVPDDGCISSFRSCAIP